MSGMAEVLAAHQTIDVALYPDYYCCSCGHKSMEQPPIHKAAMLTAAGFGPVREAGAVALEEAADAWRQYLPAVAGYGNVQPVPVWLERRAEWRRRA